MHSTQDAEGEQQLTQRATTTFLDNSSSPEITNPTFNAVKGNQYNLDKGRDTHYICLLAALVVVLALAFLFAGAVLWMVLGISKMP
ncbi:hypothetical protein K435DRAFT_960638 [Dendrothele bispora CBS 962.96]|uniref:Uncharacterized protein n=1 Tax=Dendrothele bispora (strain CBS 962.96) TaxID=1314807 RepID=A0A4S8MTC0_DENBC|nr:hypothetical protein K435DRAFT_960638 [Dendrothele bispora CBS 962.96]